MMYPHLAQRIFNIPLAIAPQKAEIIVSALSGRLGVSELERADGTMLPLEASTIGSNVSAGPDATGYDNIEGVAVMKVMGTLVHKNGALRPFSGMTGYDGLRHNFISAMNDPQIRGIAFDIDSGGGEVAGCFDLVDTIYKARGTKPMVAILSEVAFSAAYAIASACDCITVPRTGGVGSVGVVGMHVDYSEMLKKTGVKVTMIHYGARKIDGNETQPLSNDALKRLQANVDTMGELFVRTVARNRGMPIKAVRNTEAGIFSGADGVACGFADECLAPDDGFDVIRQLIN